MPLNGFLFCFKLAPKVKEAKAKTENTDPNVQKEPKAKDGTKKPKKSGEIKMVKLLYNPVIYILNVATFQRCKEERCCQ